MKRLARALLVFLLLGAVPRAARADEPVAAEAEAREAMQTGITRFGRGDAAGALEAYERAKKLVPAANLPYRYAAEALAALGRPREAMENLRTYLEKNPSVSDASVVRARIADLEAKLSRGDLGVRATVAGAQLSIDGGEPRALPLEVTLLAGEHTVVVTREGYARLEQKVLVSAGQHADLVLSLVPVSPAARPAPTEASVPTVWPAVGVVGLGAGGAGLVVAAVLDATLGAKLSELDRAALAGDPRAGEIQSEAAGLRTATQVAYVASVVTVLAGAAVLVFAPHRLARPATGAAAAPFVIRF